MDIKKDNNFLEGPILAALMKFVVPIIMALFLQALYGAADLWAVGTFATAADISAVSTASQVMLIITSFITGITMGTTVLLGRRLGEKRFDSASKVFGGTMWILLAMGFVFTLIITVFAKKIAIIANAPSVALEQTGDYLRICGFGIVFILAYNGISALFRGIGNSKLPLFFVLIACIFNISGDVILIKYFHLGAKGAAISTVFAQSISVILSVVFISRYKFPFKLTKNSFAFDWNTVAKILGLGFPIALLQMCNEFYYLILISFVNKLGVIPSAGVGVAEKLIIFLVLVPLAFMSAISSFSSFNYGAKNLKRAKEGLWKGMVVSGSLGAVLALLLFTEGDVLSSIFSDNVEVMKASAKFLKATSLECFILSIGNCLAGYFNGIGRSTFVMIEGLIAIFAFKIPYALFAMNFTADKLFNLGISTVIGAFASLVMCAGYFILLSFKEDKGKLVDKEWKAEYEANCKTDVTVA